MCGISGIWVQSQVIELSEITRFNNSMKHRGPDGEGYFIDPEKKIALGHRRLAILDLSDKGRQPMEYLERYQITFNGEIYNFIEIRELLVTSGYHFKSDSDTEVIMAAYDAWGAACLNKFNGMWSFAIWDQKLKKLFLARDRFGVKPLYYMQEKGSLFAFASETIAFKYLDRYQREFDDKKLSIAIRDAMALEGSGHTIYRNIFQILPGHYLELENVNQSIKQKRWWQTFENLSVSESSYEQQVIAFKELLIDSTRLRLRSDVPVATALSGGVDSTAIYSILNHLEGIGNNTERSTDDWQRAYSAIFPGSANDEQIYAQSVVDHFGKKINFATFNSGNLADELVSSTKLFDAIYFTPLMSVSGVYMKMRRDGVSVSLDGHGADEMMYGYPFLMINLFKYYSRSDIEYANDIKFIYNQMYSEGFKQEIETLLPASRFESLSYTLKKYYQYVPKQLKDLYRIMVRGKYNQIQSLSDSPYDFSNLTLPDRMVAEMFHLGTLPTILRNFDRAAMQAGVEIRMPFMDYRLVDYVFSLPVKSKLGHGFTKRILRDAMYGIMPEVIRTRTSKIGLNAPLADWFNNELSELVLDTVGSSKFINSPFWNGYRIKALAEENYRNKGWTWSNSFEVWQALNAYILLYY